MILVWSTSENFRSMAHWRTDWRTTTMSWPDRMARDSVLTTAMPVASVADGVAEELHASLDVQGGPHPGQPKPQFYQRDGHRRLHTHHHRLGIQHPGHGGDVPQHAADEGVDDLQGRDVDQDPPSPRLHDSPGQIVLQGEGQPV